jgi:ribosomal 50S subunit-associated protein YjgA (DUF615 family)
MDNMRELEKRWYFYKAKQSLLSLNAFGLVVMCSLGSYYSYTQADVIKNFFSEKTLISETKIKTPEVIVEPVLVAKAIEEPIIKVVQPTEVVIASKNEGLSNTVLHEVSLEPIIPIVNMEKESHKKASSKRVYKSAKHTNKSTQNSHRKMVKAKASTYLTASELSTIKKEIVVLDSERTKKINLNGSSANYIETMKKKFFKSKRPREALLLAKAFYAKREYSNSEKWALTANKLDSSKDESWHIFAMSKVKLGHKSEALKILSSYYKKSHSSKTKALIIKIKTERL